MMQCNGGSVSSSTNATLYPPPFDCHSYQCVELTLTSDTTHVNTNWPLVTVGVGSVQSLMTSCGDNKSARQLSCADGGRLHGVRIRRVTADICLLTYDGYLMRARLTVIG